MSSFFKKYFIIPVLLSTLFGICFTGTVAIATDPTDASLGVSFKLKIGESAFIKDGNMKLMFDSVAEDSRCWKNTVCKWEGQAKLNIKAWKNGVDMGSVTPVKREGHDELAKQTFDKYSIQLLQLDPYPENAAITDTSVYQATLVVSNNF